MARLTKKVNLGVPRLIAAALLIAVISIQYPLWAGKGSFANLKDLESQLAAQKESNAALEAELELLQSEADSLRHGSDALESRAREKLNMIRDNEILFRRAP